MLHPPSYSPLREEPCTAAPPGQNTAPDPHMAHFLLFHSQLKATSSGDLLLTSHSITAPYVILGGGCLHVSLLWTTLCPLRGHRTFSDSFSNPHPRRQGTQGLSWGGEQPWAALLHAGTGWIPVDSELVASALSGGCPVGSSWLEGSSFLKVSRVKNRNELLFPGISPWVFCSFLLSR